MSGGKSFTAATVQAAPVFLDRKGTVEKVIRLIKEAAGEGAELVVFPEAFIPTYPYWPKDLGFGPEKKLTMDAHVELHRNSVEVPGEDTKKFGEAARKAKTYVVIGVNEKEGGNALQHHTVLRQGRRSFGANTESSCRLTARNASGLTEPRRT